MNTDINLPKGHIAFSVTSLAESCSLGETLIWEAVKSGEIKTKKLVVGGKGRKRRVILLPDALEWLNTFPDYPPADT